MGKLHTLRRAIEREPDIWMDVYPGRREAKGAIFIDSQWKPYHYSMWSKVVFTDKRDKNGRQYHWSRKNQTGFLSYRKFVRHTLRQLGYVVG